MFVWVSTDEFRDVMGEHVKVHFRLVQDKDGYPPAAVESVWAARTGAIGEYLIDSIPFFTNEATLGDLVEAREQDDQLWFKSLLRESRNSLIRVVLLHETRAADVRAQLAARGCSTEYIGAYTLIAVNVPDNVKLTDIEQYLRTEADAGHLDYEEPILRHT